MNNQIKVMLSNHHIHLSKEMQELFFGDKPLTIKSYLSADNKYYAAEETVTVSGPKGSLENIRILGPSRKYTQVELLKGDSYVLGVKPPVRESGDLGDAVDLTVTCNGKTVLVPKCGILAQRHIHMSGDQMEELGIEEKQLVSVKVSGERGLTFDQVLVRRAKDDVTVTHIDTEEGNAANIGNGDFVELII